MVMNTWDYDYIVHETLLFQKSEKNPILHDLTPLNVIVLLFFVFWGCLEQIKGQNISALFVLRITDQHLNPVSSQQKYV